MPSMSTQRQVQEIIQCGKDPAYFFNKYAKIQHPIKGLVPFNTFPFQDDCVQDFIDNKFNVVLKSRQLGLSTLCAAYAVWLALFYKDQNILIIATKQAVAQNIIRKVKTVINNLPPWMFLTKITANNKTTIELANGSSIKAVPTSEDAGRSEALSLLIIDEAAFIRNFDDLWTSLYPTLSTGGRAIVLSTPNGVGGMYHDIYSKAEAGLSEFNPIKLPWDVHPERDQEWFESQTKNFSERKIAQEFLCDFLASGDTFLGNDDVRWVSSTVKPPIRRMGPANNVWIWKMPLTQHKYIISADVSRGDAKDFSTFVVMDVTEGEVVAEYKGKIRPDNLAELLVEFGEMYNKALVCPENNTYGYAVCLKLKEMGYPKMYYQTEKGVFLGDYIPPQDLSKAGFNTNGGSRNKILAKLEEVVRNKTIKCYSSRFADELKTFVWQNDKAQAMRGKNDDLVMAYAIGVWLYDAAGGYSQNSASENQAMLAGMSTSGKQFNQPEVRGNARQSSWNPFVPISPSGNDHVGMNSTQRRDIQMAKDIKWLFK